MIPFGDLHRTVRRHHEEVAARMDAVLERGWFILGQELEEFEAAFAAYLGVRHVIGVGNGTDAIALALRALGVQPGDEVITSPLSAAFTAMGIVQAGAVPVFADVNPVTCNLDPDTAAAVMGPRTAALMPVHLYGRPAPMDAFRELADRHGIAVIEDAAQAHGAWYGGARAGSIGDAASFSFYPTKNLGAYGDAGAVTTGSDDVADRVRRMRDGGQDAKYSHVELGVNSRLDELQAAVLNARLPHLDGENARRAEIAARFSAALKGAWPALKVVGQPDDTTVSSHHLYVVRAQDRVHFAEHMARSGVATAVHYPTPLHMQPAFTAGAAATGSLPHAERAATEVISLPSFPELEEHEVDTIVEALLSYAASAREGATVDRATAAT
jgi:dTDP-4-amino-4,6-dideoxygalactose transaminase